MLHIQTIRIVTKDEILALGAISNVKIAVHVHPTVPAAIPRVAAHLQVPHAQFAQLAVG